MAVGKKTGGRQKGTTNKDKQILLDRINQKYPNYCPVEALCEIATTMDNEINIRLAASKEVAQYIYPKLKAMELYGKDGGAIETKDVSVNDKEILARYLNSKQEVK